MYDFYGWFYLVPFPLPPLLFTCHQQLEQRLDLLSDQSNLLTLVPLSWQLLTVFAAICTQVWQAELFSVPLLGSELAFPISFFSSAETALLLYNLNRGALGSGFPLPATSSQSVTNLLCVCLPLLSIESVTFKGCYAVICPARLVWKLSFLPWDAGLTKGTCAVLLMEFFSSSEVGTCCLQWSQGARASKGSLQDLLCSCGGTTVSH